MLSFLSVLILSQILLVTSVQRWYYTGNYRPDREEPPAKQWFDGFELDFETLFDSTHGNISTRPILHTGNLVILADIDAKNQLDDKSIQYLLRNVSLISPQHSSHSLTVLSTVVYNIHGMSPYGTVQFLPEGDNSTWSLMEEEIGLFDTVENRFIERLWRYTRFGGLYAIQAEESVASEDGDESNAVIRHNVIITLDIYRRPSLIYHTRSSSSSSSPVALPVIDREGASDSNSDEMEASVDLEGNVLLPSSSRKEKKEEPVVSKESQKKDEDGELSQSLRVMTYNLWNNNPPSWIYTSSRARWERYDQRMQHFANIVIDQDPDVLTIQEVRIDSTFFGKEMTYFLTELTGELKKPDGGNQVEHLLSKLRYAWKEKHGHHAESLSFPEYQIVYQPAMHMNNEGGKPTDRNEEGCLIISKYPIVSSQIAFLPRDIGNPRYGMVSFAVG